MTLIYLKQVKKAFGDQVVLRNISFCIAQGERVGIVGGNGCGKSTLLDLIAGNEQPDAGQLYLSSPISIAFLKQNAVFDSTESLELSVQAEAEARKHCRRMKADEDKLQYAANLSSGERMKLALSRIVSLRPDLLLLDEPTNHIDSAGIAALIEILRGYRGTALTVSHDRYFLDRTVERVIEIERGESVCYNGNYSAYREEKARVFQERMHRYREGEKRRQQVKETIDQVKAWSKKAHRDSTAPNASGQKIGMKEFNRAKAKHMDRQVKSQVKRLEKLMATEEEKPATEQRVYFEIARGSTRGKRILQAAALEKSYEKVPLFGPSDFFILRGERVALFGPNGCGKSTLINILRGVECEDGGELWLTQGCAPYVLTQTLADLPERKNALQYLNERLGRVTGEDRIILNNMGISARHLTQNIGALSCGERMKLKLAEPILQKREFIVLDEPTNHLDLPTREMLEQTLAAYQGTLLLVSHDIYFVQAVCDKVLIFDRGRICRLEYSFAEYVERAGLDQSFFDKDGSNA